MRKIFMTLLASLLLPGAQAVELTVKCAKVALKPGETQAIAALCDNRKSSAAFKGKLRVSFEHDIADRQELAFQAIELEKGEKKEFTFKLTPQQEYWGCAARAELMDADSEVAESSYAFTVTNNLPQASPAMGTNHSLGNLTPEAVRARVQEFADCGVPLVEIYSWSPNLWGDLVNPTTPEWQSGQGNRGDGYHETAENLSAFIDTAHAHGIAVYSYAQCCFRGKSTKNWLQEHPEDFLYRAPGEKIALSDKEVVAAANPLSLQGLDTSLDSYAKAFNRFKFDGVRWDGHPGLFYSPLGDWMVRCNKGVSSYPYDSQGNPLLTDDPDSTNLQLLAHVRKRLGSEVPGLLWGFNFGYGPPKFGGGYNNVFPATFRALAEGNLILQERHFHSVNGRPNIWMNQNWSVMVEDLSYASDLMSALGGYLYRGDFGAGACEAFEKHAFAFHYASRARTFGVAPWYGKDAKFPYDFIRFALRHGKFLFHPGLMRFDPQKPLRRVSVTSKTPFPLIYENFCYDLFLDKKFRSVVHLLNSPVTDQVNTEKMVEPPYMADGVAVSLAQPLGLDRGSAKYYALSPEWPGWTVELHPDRSKDVVTLEVPAFRYWAMVICEYDALAGKHQASSGKEMFLPVEH